MIFHSNQRKIEKNINHAYLGQTPSVIKIDDVPIKRVDSHIFLGIKIHENLKWGPHIEHISAKISRIIGVMKHIRSYIQIIS